MRRRGKITQWKDDQGFGFITPDDGEENGGEDVFVHIKSFESRKQRPSEGDEVTYELGTDRQGRSQAERVDFAGVAAPWKRLSNGNRACIILVAAFFAFLVGAVLLKRLSWIVAGVYPIASLIAFYLYAHDKSAAQAGRWRTPESTLHLSSLLGGWPGGLLAQTMLRHKSSKRSFQAVFWATVILNGAALGWLLKTGGFAWLPTL